MGSSITCLLRGSREPGSRKLPETGKVNRMSWFCQLAFFVSNESENPLAGRTRPNNSYNWHFSITRLNTRFLCRFSLPSCFAGN